MSRIQNAVDMIADMNRDQYHIKPHHYEREPVRVSFSSAVAIVVSVIGLIYLIAGVV